MLTCWHIHWIRMASPGEGLRSVSTLQHGLHSGTEAGVVVDAGLANLGRLVQSHTCLCWKSTGFVGCAALSTCMTLDSGAVLTPRALQSWQQQRRLHQQQPLLFLWRSNLMSLFGNL